MLEGHLFGLAGVAFADRHLGQTQSAVRREISFSRLCDTLTDAHQQLGHPEHSKVLPQSSHFIFLAMGQQQRFGLAGL